MITRAIKVNSCQCYECVTVTVTVTVDHYGRWPQIVNSKASAPVDKRDFSTPSTLATRNRGDPI